MTNPEPCKPSLPLTTIASLIVVTAAALLLTWAAAAAHTGADVEAVKRGPPFASHGDLITYTIQVTNRGDDTPSVTLRDEIPGGVTFESCTYRYLGGGTMPCSAPPTLWEAKPLPPGLTLQTTLVVRVTAGTLIFPIVNRATVTVDGIEMPLDPVTTIVNPQRLYLPLVARAVAP